MQHLAEVWNSNRMKFMHSPHKDGTLPDRARAICEKKGVLHNANQNFDNLILTEWPDWRGLQFPGVLLDTLSVKGQRQYTGLGFVATIHAFNDMLLLTVRRKSTVDQLKPS